MLNLLCFLTKFVKKQIQGKMIDFTRRTLDNGLRVIVHEDMSTPLVAMNILYDVGSRDEDPSLTGLAHLFEHLMYGGSVNIPEYDKPLQMAGGENNAFTSNDITNYYLTLPARNIETGFWLESDRMFELCFSQKSLDVQKNVVIQEFNQRYLNQPYGDTMLLLRPLAYKVHPYRWPTIGMDVSHIRNTDLERIKEFFFYHYAPNNAIVCLAGSITPDNGFALAEKWFGSIPWRNVRVRNLPAEPLQESPRSLTVERNVPSNALYKAWHIGQRLSDGFHIMDFLTDLLAGGESGRLYTELVRGKNLFSEINAFLTSDIDPGLIIVTCKLMGGVDIINAENSVNEVINDMIENDLAEEEMEKVKNKFESSTVLSNTSILNKAMSLSYYELLGDPSLINSEIEKFRSVDSQMLKETGSKYIRPENCTTIYYMSSKKEQI